MANLAYYWSKLLKKLPGSALKQSIVHPSSKVEAGSEVVNSRFDKHSFCGYFCKIFNCDIGSFCSIADRVVIGGGMHPMSWISTSPAFYIGRDSIKAKFSEHPRDPPLRTCIGHDVWIGDCVLVRQGVAIGTGAVVGMGSVVTHDVPPYAIVAGAPARILRYRFEPDLIAGMLASRWWEMDEAMLKHFAVHAREPREFIRRLQI